MTLSADTMKQIASSEKNYTKEFILITFVGFSCIGFLENTFMNSLPLFAIFLGVASIYFYFKPLHFPYFAILFLTFRYTFTYVEYGQSDLFLDFLRRAKQTQPFCQYIDEFISVFTIAVCFHSMFFRAERLPDIFKKLLIPLGVFVFLSVFSALANGVSTIRLMYFLSLFLAFPFTVLYVIRLKIDKDESMRLFRFALFCAVPVQICFGFLQNVRSLANFNFIFVDNMIGSFVFPYSTIAVFLLVIGVFYYILRMVLKVGKTYSNLVWLFFIFLTIVSASAGFITVILVTSIGIILIYTFLTMLKRAVGIWKVLVLGFTIFFCAVGFVQYGENVVGYGDVVEWTSFKVRKYLSSTLHDVPKSQTFFNWFEMCERKKSFNFGVGPGNYLSGAALKYLGPLTMKYSSVEQLGRGKVGFGETMENDFVGLAGEVGIWGYLAYVSFYVYLFITYNSALKFDNNLKHGILYLLSNALIVFFLILSFGFLLFENKEVALIYGVVLGSTLKIVIINRKSIK